MDILEEFKPFLVNWCKEHHKPCPEEGVMNHIWQQAWQNYMETYLTENWARNKEDYLNLKLLTKREQRKREVEEENKKRLEAIQQQEVEEVEEIEEPTEAPIEEKELSDWEKVKRMRK